MRPNGQKLFDVAAAMLVALLWVGLCQARAMVAGRLPSVADAIPDMVPLAICWTALFALLYLAVRGRMGAEAHAMAITVGALSTIGFVELYRLAPELAVKHPQFRSDMLEIPVKHTRFAMGGFGLLGFMALLWSQWRGRLLGMIECSAAWVMHLSIPLIIASGFIRHGFGTLPLEVFKVVFVVCLVQVMSAQLEIYTKPRGVREWLQTCGLPLLLVAATALVPLLRRRPDTGPAVIVTATLALVLFVCGRKMMAAAVVVSVLAVGALCYKVLRFPPLLVARFDAAFHPFDASNDTLARALWALSGAGWSGTGLGQGMAASDVPEVEADLNFVAVAEELGFAGGSTLILLYLIFVAACFLLALRKQSLWERTLILGIACLFAVQSALIIGGNLACAPLTGVTLPFVSRGGASLVVSLALTGILIGLSMEHGEENKGLLPYLESVRLAVDRHIRAAFVILLLGLGCLFFRCADVQLIRPTHYQSQVFINSELVEKAAWLVAQGIVRDDGKGGIVCEASRLSNEKGAWIKRDAALRWVSLGMFENKKGRVGVVRQAFAISNPAFRREEAQIVRGRIRDASGSACHVNDAWFGFNHLRYGRSGLVAALMPYLLGRQGQNLLDRSVGQWRGVRAGNDVYLTLSPRVQRVAEESLRGRKGIVVAMEPATGTLLALASSPTFPFATASDAQWERARRDAEDNPFFPKTLRGHFPPGSIFKVFIAAAALENGWDIKRTLVCRGHFRVPRADYTVDDTQASSARFRGHGRIALGRALEVSCNCFFAQLALWLGAERLAAYFEKAGLTQDFDLVHLSDEPARQLRLSPCRLCMSPEELINPAMVAQSGFGQAQVIVNPVAYLLFVSAVANDGVMMEPRLVHKVVSASGISLTKTPTRAWRRVMSGKTARSLAQMMVGVVERGTGRNVRIARVKVAGKTGSAQHGRSDGSGNPLPPHAWFVAFAPVERPRVAVLVLIEEGGMGGRAAAPIARRVMETVLAKR